MATTTQQFDSPAIIGEIQGQAFVRLSSGQQVQAKEGMALQLGDTVFSDANSGAVIYLAEGGSANCGGGGEEDAVAVEDALLDFFADAQAEVEDFSAADAQMEEFLEIVLAEAGINKDDLESSEFDDLIEDEATAAGPGEGAPISDTGPTVLQTPIDGPDRTPTQNEPTAPARDPAPAPTPPPPSADLFSQSLTENTATPVITLADVTVDESGTITYSASIDTAPETDLVITLSNGVTITIAAGELTGSSEPQAAQGEDVYADAATSTISITGTTGGGFDEIDTTSTATLTVSDTVNTTTITVGSVSIDEDATSYSYTVTLDNAPNADFTVTLSDGSQVTFASGETSKTVTTAISADSDVFAESDGTTTLSVSNYTTGIFEDVATSSGTLTVTDSTDTTTVTVADVSIDETASSYTVGVSIDNTPQTAFTVTLSNGATVTFGTDYVPGTVVQSSSVSISEDDVYDEGDETTVISITGTSGGNFEALNTSDTGNLTISDVDDTTTLTVTYVDADGQAITTLEEGGTYYVKVATDNTPETDLTVTLNIPGGTTTNLTIAAGATAATSAALTAPLVDADTNYTLSVASTTGGNYEALITSTTDTLSVTNAGGIPSIDINPSINSDALQVDDTTLGSASEDFSDNFSQAADYGDDGAGSISVGYALTVTNSVSGLVDSQTNEAITLVDNSGTIEGRTASTNVLVFSIATNSAGVVTISQARAIEHANTSSNNESVALDSGTVRLTRTDTITDSDGDSATDSAFIDLGGRITFLDDGPTITSAMHTFLSDVTGTSVVVDLGVNVGNDKIGSSVALNVTANGAVQDAVEGTTLTLNGFALRWVESGGTYYATSTETDDAGNERQAFSITPSIESDGNVIYTTTIIDGIDPVVIDKFDIGAANSDNNASNQIGLEDHPDLDGNAKIFYANGSNGFTLTLDGYQADLTVTGSGGSRTYSLDSDATWEQVGVNASTQGIGVGNGQWVEWKESGGSYVQKMRLTFTGTSARDTDALGMRIDHLFTDESLTWQAYNASGTAIGILSPGSTANSDGTFKFIGTASSGSSGAADELTIFRASADIAYIELTADSNSDFRLDLSDVIFLSTSEKAKLDLTATVTDADGDATSAIPFSVYIDQTISTGDGTDDTFAIADSTEAVIVDFDLNASGAGDTLDFDGSVSVVADDTSITSSGVSGTSIDGHNISDGIVTFFDSTEQVQITSAERIESAIEYLQATDLGNANVTVAFKATIDGATSTYVYNQNTDAAGSFSLVKLDGTDAVGIDTSNGSGTDDYIHID